MSRATYDHAHQYVAINSKRKTYRCTYPDCPHSLPATLLLNRKAACVSCGNELLVTTEHLRRSNIACIDSGCSRKFAGNLPLHQQPDVPQDKISAASLLDKLGIRR